MMAVHPGDHLPAAFPVALWSNALEVIAMIREASYDNRRRFAVRLSHEVVVIPEPASKPAHSGRGLAERATVRRSIIS